MLCVPLDDILLLNVAVACMKLQLTILGCLSQWLATCGMCWIAAFEHTKQRLLTQLIHDFSYLKTYILFGFLFTFPLWITAQLSPKVWSVDPLKSYQGAILSKKGLLLYWIFFIFYEIRFPIITAQNGVESAQ